MSSVSHRVVALNPRPVAESSVVSMPPPPVRELVARAVRRYLEDLGPTGISDLHRVMLAEIESPMLGEVMKHVGGNQSKAAQVLGISRATLRKKLVDLKLV